MAPKPKPKDAKQKGVHVRMILIDWKKVQKASAGLKGGMAQWLLNAAQPAIDKLPEPNQ